MKGYEKKKKVLEKVCCGNAGQTMSSYRNAHQSESLSNHFVRKKTYDAILPELRRTRKKQRGDLVWRLEINA